MVNFQNKRSLLQVYRRGNIGPEIGHFLCQFSSMNLLIHDMEKR